MNAERRAEVNITIARIMEPDLEWTTAEGCSSASGWIVRAIDMEGRGNSNSDRRVAASFDFPGDLNDCHDAAMWLRENHPDGYVRYQGRIELWWDKHYEEVVLSDGTHTPVYGEIDAPAEVRAEALFEAMKELKRD